MKNPKQITKIIIEYSESTSLIKDILKSNINWYNISFAVNHSDKIL